MQAALLFLLACAWPARAAWGPYEASSFESAQRAGWVILLQFTEDGCQRCADQDKILSRRFWGASKKDWTGFQVALTNQAAVAKRWRVTAPSTLVLLRGTRELARVTGIIVDAEIDAFLRKAELPEPHGRAPPRPRLRWPPRP